MASPIVTGITRASLYAGRIRLTSSAAFIREMSILAVADHQHIAVLHDVLLAFEAQLALVARSGVAAQIHQGLPIHNLGADELLFEIRMDGAGRLDRGTVHRNGPGAAFIFSSGEETHQAKQ